MHRPWHRELGLSSCRFESARISDGVCRGREELDYFVDVDRITKFEPRRKQGQPGSEVEMEIRH